MTSTNVTFQMRPARPGDFDEIAGIWHRSASLDGVGPPVMPPILELRERVDEEIAKGWHLTVVCEGPRALGFLAIKQKERILDQLFVDPSAIGTGLGRALFELAKQLMPDGFKLHTASTNQRARKFYEKTGMSHLYDSSHPRTGHPVSYYGWKLN